MYGRPLVPDTFTVPARYEGPGWHLRMLSVDDVEKDYEAVMASAARLKGLLDPESPWPEGLTAREDLVDLAWHEREFTLRHSFAYTMMAADESLCLGCCYLFPANTDAFDAAAFYWVREGSEAEAREREFGRHLRTWLADVWPFERVAFPGREQSWDDWRSLNTR